MKHQLHETQTKTKQEVQILTVAMEEKEQLVRVQRTERDSIESDKDRYHAIVTQQEK